MPSIDWAQMFIPSGNVLELIIRGTILYLGLLFFLRVLRREAGELNRADLLVVILVADAAQNGMAGNYQSITEGLVLVATIFGWNFLLDWASYRWEPVRGLLNPAPLILIRDGRIIGRHLRAEMITRDDLMEQLREQGVESVSEVKRCFLESDGRLSVIRKAIAGEATPRKQQATV